MKHVFVIRHGQTDVNKGNIIQGRGVNAPINDLGLMQAQAILKALEDFPIRKIVTSSLHRTWQTAEPLVQKFGSAHESHTDLDELDFGEFEGRKFSAIQPQLDEIHAQWEAGNVGLAIPGGESPLEAFRRADNRVQQILQSSQESHIAFILHGRLIRILLSEWLGLGLRNMHKVEHQNGAVNHLKWENGKFEAVELNKTDHLLELI